jgi:hypothetical protein
MLQGLKPEASGGFTQGLKPLPPKESEKSGAEGSERRWFS